MDYRGLVDHGEIWKKLAGSIFIKYFLNVLTIKDLAAKRIGFCLITTGLFVCFVLKNINRQFEFY